MLNRKPTVIVGIDLWGIPRQHRDLKGLLRGLSVYCWKVKGSSSTRKVVFHYHDFVDDRAHSARYIATNLFAKIAGV